MKKFFLFIIILPVVYFFIKIQIIIGVLFVLYYYIIFFLFYFFLKVPQNIECKEIPLNFSFMFRYTIVNILFLVPRAKAFIIVYYSLFHIYNRNNKFNVKTFLFLLFMIFIVFWIKITILLFIGYSYLSLLVASDIIVNFFGLLNLNFETRKAQY